MSQSREAVRAPSAGRDVPGFAVIVGAARSGTTLLRLLLGAHPEIGCPAEAGIPSLIGNLSRVWWTIDADLLDEQTADPLETQEEGVAARENGNGGAQARQIARVPDLPGEARAAIRDAAIAPMRHYCEREGTRIYCDKSLDSVFHLEAVRQIFPRTRHVLLYRHVMDTVASGLEASPWGFQAYGYIPFVQRSPDNFVAALVSYWLSHVDAALRWEKAHGEQCHRVRYEDLVTDPERVVSEIFAFLGVDQDPGVLERALVHARSAKGPGDYKVMFTTGIDRGSIGHGKRVPVAMVPPPLLEAANEKLEALGYEPLGAWNAEPTQADGRARQLDGRAARLAGILEGVRPVIGMSDRTIDSFALVAQDHEQLRWVVDLAAGTIQQGDGEAECVLTGTAEDLAQLLAGEVNAGVLLRGGRIRHLTAAEDAHPPDALQAVQLVLDALGAGRQGLPE